MAAAIRVFAASLAVAAAQDGEGFSGLVPDRFQGQVCLVTGATSGLGEFTAYHLAREGCAVVITGRREDKGKLVEASTAKFSTSKAATKALFVANDVTNYPSMAQVMDVINSTWGRLDAVFANAGVSGQPGSADVISTEEFQWVMNVNVVGVFNTVHFAVPLMKQVSDAKPKSGGSIVLCSSIYGHTGGPYQGPYVTSKHALEGMKKEMAATFFNYGIRVNNVNPTFTASEMTAMVETNPVLNDLIVKNLPGQRMATPGEIAATVAYLLSGHSAHISGQSLVVDGGAINNWIPTVQIDQAFAKVAEQVAAAAPKSEL